MNFEYIASRLVQPSHNNNLVSDGEPIQSFDSEGSSLEPGIRRSFRPLHRGMFALLQNGSNGSYWTKSGQAGFAQSFFAGCN